MSGFSGPSLAGNVNIGGDLTWAGAAQLTWTPTITCQTPGVTPPTFSLIQAQYKTYGKLTVYSLNFSVTAAGTGANSIFVTMPSATSVFFMGAGSENAVTGSSLSVGTSNTTTIAIRDYKNTGLIATGANFVVNGVYFG